MNRYNILCILFVSFGSVFYGYDSACTTSILGYPSFIEYFNLDATTIGAFGAAYYGGAVIGMASNWYLPNKFGRVRTIQIACVVSLLASAMQCGASSFPVFCTGRIIGGYATGLMFVVCPTFASEIAPPHLRGRVGGLYSVAVNGSYAFTEWVGLGFYFIKTGNISWRLLLGCQLIPAVAMLIVSFWMPDSPRWLVYVERNDEALVILQKLHQSTEDDDFYLREFHQIKAQIDLDKHEKLGMSAIWKRPSYRRRFLLVFSYAIACMLSGVIVIQNYQVLLYQKIGFSNTMSLVLTGIWGSVGTVSAIISAICFDFYGRRPTMFTSWGLIILGSLLTVITWAVFENGGSTDKSLARGIIACMFTVGLGYGGPANTFLATYPAEIMPTAIRATGVAVSYMSQHIMIIVLVQSTPIAIDRISWRFFLIFLCSSSIFSIAFYFFYPETKNKTLEELEAVFGDEVAETIEEAGQHVDDVRLGKLDEKIVHQTDYKEIAFHSETAKV